MSAARQKGTAAESAVVTYLQANGWPFAERRALAGALDKGDVTGTPGICWEVKAGARLDIPGWLRETAAEQANSNSRFGLLVVKPKGVGVTRVAEWWTVQPLWQAGLMLNAAGYGDER